MEILLEQIIDLVDEYKSVIFWLSLLSFFIFIFSLVSIKWLVALIPIDYFVYKKNSKFKTKYPFTWLISMIIKNIIGYLLIVGGILMLVLPGQGLFTIFIGLMMSNYPGKYYIEKKIIAIPSILKTINWLRKQSNKEPIIIN
ncbi:MAG: hypothetical protein CMQ77_02725 [Gammaproteobacteria bacterium]|nr:hypothetical protein [Gammaproteobacteria bacterium]